MVSFLAWAPVVGDAVAKAAEDLGEIYAPTPSQQLKKEEIETKREELEAKRRELEYAKEFSPLQHAVERLKLERLLSGGKQIKSVKYEKDVGKLLVENTDGTYEWQDAPPTIHKLPEGDQAVMDAVTRLQRGQGTPEEQARDRAYLRYKGQGQVKAVSPTGEALPDPLSIFGLGGTPTPSSAPSGVPSSGIAPRAGGGPVPAAGGQAPPKAQTQIEAYYQQMVIDTAREMGYDDPALAMAVIQQENPRWDPTSHDSHGERFGAGMAGITQRTGNQYGMDWDKRYDAKENIRAEIRYLKDLDKRYRGDRWAALEEYGGVNEPDPTIPRDRQYPEHVMRNYVSMLRRVRNMETPEGEQPPSQDWAALNPSTATAPPTATSTPAQDAAYRQQNLTLAQAPPPAATPTAQIPLAAPAPSVLPGSSLPLRLPGTPETPGGQTVKSAAETQSSVNRAEQVPAPKEDQEAMALQLIAQQRIPPGEYSVVPGTAGRIDLNQLKPEYRHMIFDELGKAKANGQHLRRMQNARSYIATLNAMDVAENFFKEVEPLLVPQNVGAIGKVRQAYYSVIMASPLVDEPTKEEIRTQGSYKDIKAVRTFAHALIYAHANLIKELASEGGPLRGVIGNDLQFVTEFFKPNSWFGSAQTAKDGLEAMRRVIKAGRPVPEKMVRSFGLDPQTFQLLEGTPPLEQAPSGITDFNALYDSMQPLMGGQ